jgi:hypothetical protein
VANTAYQLRVNLNLILSGGLPNFIGLTNNGRDRIGTDAHFAGIFSQPHAFLVQKLNHLTANIFLAVPVTNQFEIG